MGIDNSISEDFQNLSGKAVHENEPRVSPYPHDGLFLARLCERMHAQILAMENEQWSRACEMEQRLERLCGIKDKEIEILRAQVRERDLVIQSIVHSTAWKISWPYRKVGTAILFMLSALRDLVLSPKAKSIQMLRAAANKVRMSSVLRPAAHKVFAALPSSVRERLTSIAPPTPAQAGVSPAITGFANGLGGEWQWIYNQIRN